MDKKIAVVTGANRGLGFAVSKELASRDFLVIMVGRNKSRLETACADLQGLGYSVGSFVADISNDLDVENLVSYLKSKDQQVAVLVNNAGVFLDKSDPVDVASLLHVDPETVLRTFQINTLGAFKLIQKIVPMMKKSNFGRIVNVSSGMGQLSHMDGAYPAYRISKTALNAITKILAAEITGQNIKVNSICPGWVKTDMGGAAAPRSIEEGIQGIVWAATLPDDGPSGGFFRDGEPLEW